MHNGMRQIDLQHRELIGKANASVSNAQAKAEKDPLRPIYHLTTAANWINDPNGPIFYKGEYHMFFQHNPYSDTWGNISWGHAVSKNLVQWEHLPIALTPTPGSYDKDGIFSGCCVVHDGVPTIIYTGVWPEVQCIARSYDGMRTWIKYPGNPVIDRPPRDDLEGFRDPYVWKENDIWNMLIGSGIQGEGGMALLYSSKDLVTWDYIHPFCIGFGNMWECPNFFPIGDKHVLVVSPHDEVKYSVGTYENSMFNPGLWHTMDMGGRDSFYAPNSLKDNKGRRIIWGWIMGGGNKGYPWSGVLTLPRVISLRSDDVLCVEPLPELRELRGRHYQFKEIALKPASSNILDEVKGNCLEIVVEFELGTAESFGIEVGCSPDGKEKTKIGYNRISKRLFSGNREGGFELTTDEKALRLHIFLDKSVIEVYANRRECITGRYYPKRADSLGLNLFVRGGSMKIRSLDVWEMKSIW